MRYFRRTCEFFPKLRLSIQAERSGSGLEGALGPCSKLHTHPYQPRVLLIHMPLRISFSLLTPYPPSSMPRSERIALGLVRVPGQRSGRQRKKNQSCNRVGRGGGQDTRGPGEVRAGLGRQPDPRHPHSSESAPSTCTSLTSRPGRAAGGGRRSAAARRRGGSSGGGRRWPRRARAGDPARDCLLWSGRRRGCPWC